MRQRKWQLVPQVEQPTQRPLVFLLAPHGHWIPQQFDPWGNYTMFSAPGRGPCGGPRSCLLCSWASCRTGMLHSGHTFRTSSHLIRHLEDEKTQEEDVSPGLMAPPAQMPHGLNIICPSSGVGAGVIRSQAAPPADGECLLFSGGTRPSNLKGDMKKPQHAIPANHP